MFTTSSVAPLVAALLLGQATGFVRLGHDTHDNPPAGNGPSFPCWATKAVTEGAGGKLYQGLRLYTSDLGGTQLFHSAPVTVNFLIDSTVGPAIPATVGQDYNLTYTSIVPPGQMPATTAMKITCAQATPPCNSNAGELVLNLISDDWEPPEFVRFELTSANEGMTISSQNFEGAWVVQDECESLSLFRYRNGVNLPNQLFDNTSNYLQIMAETGGVNPHGSIKFKDLVQQNYPAAASEVVTEGSYFSILFAHRSEDSTGAAGGLPGGSPVIVPQWHEIAIDFRFLELDDWQFDPPANCGTPFTSYDYAVEGEFTVQYANGSAVPFSTSGGETTYTALIPPDESLVEIRVFPTQDGTGEVHEIAHLHIDAAVKRPLPNGFFPKGGSSPVPIPIGWSSDFRFVLQDSAVCQ